MSYRVIAHMRGAYWQSVPKPCQSWQEARGEADRQRTSLGVGWDIEIERGKAVWVYDSLTRAWVKD